MIIASKQAHPLFSVPVNHLLFYFLPHTLYQLKLCYLFHCLLVSCLSLTSTITYQGPSTYLLNKWMLLPILINGRMIDNMCLEVANYFHFSALQVERHLFSCLICFSPLRDCCLVLLVVQYLKTIVLYILFVFKFWLFKMKE